MPCCPVCGSATRARLYDGLEDRMPSRTPGRWTLYRCGECGAARLDPRPAPGAIHLAYASYYTHRDLDPEPPAGAPPAPASRSPRQALRAWWFARRDGYNYQPADALEHWTGRPGTVLDVGCGNGAWLSELRRRGWDGRGLDLDPAAVAAARRAGLDVRQGALEPGSFPPATFDAVVMHHVVEHLHDPVATLRLCREVLKPGGVLWLVTPNLLSFTHTWFGRHWRGLEPPRHLVLFTPGALRRACTQAGLAVLYTGGLPAATHYGAASRALARGEDPDGAPPLAGPSAWLARLADRATWLTRRYVDELVIFARRPPA